MKQNTIIHSKLTRNLFITFALLTTLNAEYIRDDSRNVLVDTEAKLMWQDEKYTYSENLAYSNSIEVGKVLFWKNAVDYCQNLNLAGYSDWYLPNKYKLQALYKDKDNSQNMMSRAYWSASLFIFIVRGCEVSGNDKNSLYTRCVRDNNEGVTSSNVIIKIIAINTKRGYLQNNLEIEINDNGDIYDDTILKNSFMVINTENYQIIEPEEFNSVTLQKMPYLGYNPQQREIKLTPDFQRDKNLLSFELSAKVVLTDFKLGNYKSEVLKVDNSKSSKNYLNYYQSRKKKIKDFSKIYALILKGKDFQISYECQFDKDKNVSCKQKMKMEI